MNARSIITMQPVTPRRPTRRAVARPAAGFTLLEVLLALALSAVLVGAVYWALAAAFDAHRQAERITTAPRAAEYAMETLRSDLRGATRLGGVLAVEFLAEDDPAGLAHETHRLVLYTAVTPEPAREDDDSSAALRSPGMQRVEWTVGLPESDPLADRPALLRRVTDNLLAPVTAEPSEQVIASDAMTLSFRFYDGTQWTTAWNSLDQDDALPTAVEVTLGLYEAEAHRPRGAVGSDEDRAYRLTRIIALPAGDRDAEGGLVR